MPRHRSPAGPWLAGLFQFLVRLGFMAATGAGCLRAEVAPAAVPAADGGRVTSIQQYWDLPAPRKAAPVDFELACTVTYFDPEWRILFVQDDEGTAAYVPYGNAVYPFKAGEGILARGRFMPPSLDVSFEHAVITARPSPPLVPVPVTHDVTDHVRLIRRFVSMEGAVDWTRRVDDKHLQLAISVSGENVLCWVQMNPAVLTPDLLDRKIRVEGVYNPKVGPDGKMASLELMVPSLDKLSIVGQLDEDPAFQLPVTPVGRLLGEPSDKLVRVVGSVVARETGQYLRIRDGSGQIDLMTGQLRPLAVNDLVEAVGYPVAFGPTWRLEKAFFRPYSRPTVTTAHPEGPISVAADVLALSADEASKGRPVHLIGVVTWSYRSAPFFFINDSSGGVCIMRGDSGSMLRSPGRNVEVHGYTTMGAFAPVVLATKFERVSEAVLPVARTVSVEHALTGVEEAQWVEMRGYLRQFHREGDWNRLELATATSDFTAMLPATEEISPMVGSVVRLQGVCAAEADAQRRLTGVRLWVPGIAYVQVDEPAPADPFSVPLRTLSSLGQFETVQSFNRRVHVSGTVLHHVPGQSVWIEEAGHNLLVAARASTPLRPGARIEAVGFLGRQDGRIALREAVYRSTGGAGEEPRPREVEPGNPPITALDGRLVAISGLLLDSAKIGDTTHLTVQAGAVIFAATLGSGSLDLAGPVDGTRLRLTGVHEIEYDQGGAAAAFTLRLRSPADIEVLESPSWWTRGRIMAFTGLLAFGALLFVVWINALRRQVHRQTAQIRTQLERETRLQAELARAGKLESLGLLAGGIAHDFNNLLTVLMGNISLVRLDGQLSGEGAQSLDQAAKAAARARDLTQQLLTFAKGGSPLRTAVSLPEIVREVTEFALRGSKVSGRFSLPDDLWPANVDKGQIGQVVQNIVINALQVMPEGGVVDVALSNRLVGPEFGRVLASGRYLRLDITDHGPGIAPADLGRIFDPYFTTKKQGSGLGLATVHSIVKKHSGHITVDSAPGRTTFHVWLPAAESGAVVRPDSVHPVARAGTDRDVRVLVMDDEEFIRNLASSILRRNGCRVTAVSDGAAALHEYGAARDAGEPYALVILDLTIPGGMGGRQTMDELLKLDPGVKAIVSSGYSNDLVLANYQAHGFRGMISKPYDVADFTDTVERVLRGERA